MKPNGNSDRAAPTDLQAVRVIPIPAEDDFVKYVTSTMAARAQSLDVRPASPPILDRQPSSRVDRPRMVYLAATAACLVALVVTSFALAGRSSGPETEVAADASSLDALWQATIEPTSQATVIVWVDSKATAAAINNIADTLADSDNLDSYRYISQTEVLHQFQTYYRDFPDVLRAIEADDVPTYFALTFRDSIPETEHRESAEQMVVQIGAVLKIQERTQGS